MRLHSSLLLFLVFIVRIEAQQSVLDQKVSIVFEAASVTEALKQLGAKTGYFFNYANSEIAPDKRISKTYRRERLETIIKGVWGNGAILLKVSGRTIDIQSARSTSTKQKGKITGRVNDTFNQPVPFASVILKSTSFGASTNENGVFSLTAPAGSYTIATSVIGYEDVEQEVTIKSNQTVSISITVVEKREQLDEVKVYAKSKKVELEQSAKAVVVVETKVAKQQSADLGGVLSQIQGVTVQRSGGLGSRARFSLNGLTDDQIRFFIDGVPLELMGFPSGVANVPVNFLQQVEVYKGVVPITFGADALGGAVNLSSNSEVIESGGEVSYQFGSFNTHRTTVQYKYRPKIKGFYLGSDFFFDSAENNYKVEVEVSDEDGRLFEVTVPRFHDSFQAFGTRIELGWRNLSWADQLSWVGFYNQNTQDLQHNNVMTVPFGEVTFGGNTFGNLIRWKKKFKAFQSDALFGYSRNGSELEDVSRFIYTWFGERLQDDNGNEILRAESFGELGEARNVIVWDDNLYSRIQLGLKLNDRLHLNFSSAPTYVIRSGQDRLTPPGIRDPLSAEQNAFTWVNGLELKWNPTPKAFENRTFVKYYFQDVRAEQFLPGGLSLNLDRTTNTLGVGNTIRYPIGDQFAIKANYEWTTRLPRPQEIFGNGAQVTPNLELQPERSHNANLELSFQQNNPEASSLRLNANGFLRIADQLILLLGNQNLFSFQNVFSATSQGVELSAEWFSADNRLNLELNGTWQDFRNTSSEGAFETFEGERIPNRPYFFMNSSGSYQFEDTFQSKDRLSFFFNSRFINKFFRSFENTGLSQFRQEIPSQLIHNIGVTYAFTIGTSPIAATFETRNLTNVQVFDFFGVQLPRRNYAVKLNIQL
ncbi:MAG: carboxypeptidase-like regulatory domain-containing protein [Bacteroidota bacterium]